MKLQVIVDERGNIVGAIAKGRRTTDAEEVRIRPAQPEHRLHEMEVSAEVFRLSPDEFGKRLKAQHGKGSA